GGSHRAAVIHRTSGVAAVLLSLPVAFQCLWVFGFGDYTRRVLVHSLAGCVLYGAFVSKMLALHVRHLPGWALPIVGGLGLSGLVARGWSDHMHGGLFLSARVVVWMPSALWWFTS